MLKPLCSCCANVDTEAATYKTPQEVSRSARRSVATNEGVFSVFGEKKICRHGVISRRRGRIDW
jgi:hypothetical protein